MDLSQIIFCSIEVTIVNVDEEYDEDGDLDEIHHDEIEGDNDFFEFQLIFDIIRSQRSIKYQHGQMNWANHLQMLRHVNDFDGTYSMCEHAFNVLLEGIRDEITVSFLQSTRSTSDNEPIYPEIILAMCLRFLIGDLSAFLCGVPELLLVGEISTRVLCGVSNNTVVC